MPLDGAFRRVDRADERLGEFLILQDSYRLDQVQTVTVHKHPDLGYVPRVEAAGPPIPLIIPIVVGEAVYNLRAALDYLVFELAVLDSGSSKAQTQFPIEDTPELFSRRRPALLNGVSNSHATVIEWKQPYNRVAWTRSLRDISNPDKHRRLTSVRSNATGNGWVEHGPRGSFAGRPGSVHPAPDDPDVEVYVEFDGTLDIAFAGGRQIMYELPNLEAEVRLLLQEFEPCFAGECPHHGWPFERV